MYIEIYRIYSSPLYIRLDCDDERMQILTDIMIYKEVKTKTKINR